MNKDKFFRGTNTKKRWEDKHIQEYNIEKPYDFSNHTNGSQGYHSVAARIIKENIDGFNRKSLHEMGCAGGDFVSYLKNHVISEWEISAEDFSKTAIDSAIIREPNVNFSQNDFLLNSIDKEVEYHRTRYFPSVGTRNFCIHVLCCNFYVFAFKLNYGLV